MLQNRIRHGNRNRMSGRRKLHQMVSCATSVLFQSPLCPISSYGIFHGPKALVNGTPLVVDEDKPPDPSQPSALGHGLSDVFHVSLPFSAADFFKDAPWGRIPPERLAHFTVEPSGFPKGLLGGSAASGGGPPKSKLAALAAARKKENREPQKGDTTSSSVALLTRLEEVYSPQRPVQASNFDGLADVKHSSPHRGHEAKRYPVRQRKGSPPSVKRSSLVQVPQLFQNVIDSKASVQLETVPKATPSTFAKVLLGSVSCRLSPAKTPLCCRYLSTRSARKTNIAGFTGPSPDDRILKAQQSSKGSK